MKEYLKKNKFNIITFIVYIISAFIIMLYHESWRDEAQAWLITRDLSFIGIIKQMKYEGHPILWYFILMPFSKLGFPYITIKIISFIITSIAVFLILKKSPFSNIVKLLIVFSAPCIYFYPAIARSYCLIPLAIALISITYEKRKEKPIFYILSIILLANTHVIMLGLVGMLLLLFFLEEFNNRKENSKEQNKKIIISFILTVVLLIITALPIITSLGVNKDINNDFSINKLNGLIPQIKMFLYYLFETKDDTLLFAVLAILIIYEFKYYPKNLMIIIPSLLYQLLIYCFIYSNSWQRASTAIFIILCTIWIQKPKKEILKSERCFVEYLTIFLLLINVIYGFGQINTEIKYSYSNGKKTASYISENIEEGIFISSNVPYVSSIIPYLDEKYLFWNPQAEDYFTYVTWDENWRQKYNMQEFKEKIKRNFNNDENLYLINVDWDPQILEQLVEKEELTKVYEANNAIRIEDYEIYKINSKFLE